MPIYETKAYGGGIQPFFSRWMEIREYAISHHNRVENVRLFLMNLGMENVSTDVLYILSNLIWKSAQNEKFSLKHELQTFLLSENVDALRNKISYYIHQHYHIIRISVLDKYRLVMDKYPLSNKKFISYMGNLYATQMINESCADTESL